ncbi:hypothetical protein D3C72_760080 [compost metagenome]
MGHRRINKIEEVIVQHRVIFKCCLALNKSIHEIFGRLACILCSGINKVLEDVLPYPPFLIGIGEWRDALGIKLLDGLVKLCSS